MNTPPGLREVGGHWHYRFQHQGREWTGNTGYTATKQNVSKALAKFSEAQKLVAQGRANQLSTETQRFDKAAEEFLRWHEGEAEAASTARRTKTSFVSLTKAFGHMPVHGITSNDIEKFKTWRRQADIAEITIRHDLHALSLFFQFALKSNWCSVNPLDAVKIPSDKDAVRDHVVTDAEEAAYFAAALSQFTLIDEKGKKRTHGPYPSLHDVARVILDQGCRPDEVMSLRVEHVDFAKGTLRIVAGKTKAAKRTLLMTPAVKAILAARAAGRVAGWMFEGKKDGTHLSKLNNPHDAVLAKIGASFVMYQLRHTFATRYGERTGDAFALAAILGHKDLKCVMKYCHTREAHTVEAMRKYIAATATTGTATAAAAEAIN